MDLYMQKKKLSRWFSYNQMSFYGNRKFHYWWGKLINMSQLSPQDTVLIPTTPLLFKTFLEFFICDYFQSQFISYMRKINCANFFLTRNRLIWPYHPPCSSGLTSGWFISVQSLSLVQLFAAPWTAAHQASLSITNSWACSYSCPLSRWCHPTISSSVVPFSSCFLSFLASGSSQMSQFFTSGSQRIGVSASTSVLPMNIQDWFPLGWTGWISLLSKGLSRVFSNTTAQKHQFFSAQLSL